MKKTISIVLILASGMIVKVAKADFVFGEPTKVPNINSSYEEFNASISADGLSLYFISNRPGGVGPTGGLVGFDIWVTTRASIDDDWGEPVNLGATINTPAGEGGVSISYDGLSLYFDTSQSGTTAINDLWVATRATTEEDWANPVHLGPTVNSSADDYSPSISSDELSLYFTGPGRGGYGNYDLWVTTRETTEDEWGTPVNLGPTINSSGYEIDPGISADGRVLFFTIGMVNCGSRCGYGATEIWMTRRATTDDPWGEPVNLGPTVNSSAFEDYPNVSADGSTLFFRHSQSGRHDGGDIWQAPIIPIVDLNADGIVDAADMCIMVDYWGTDEPLCDIGPMPWGDGIVDVQDMIVLSEHLFEKVNDPTLIAHWALDETEGMFAADSVGDNDAVVLGGIEWQPADGQIDGALKLDGVSGYAITGEVLNPADGVFSVLAWVKSDTPGQVVLSQTNGVNWLCTDLLEGNLVSELQQNGRYSPLMSDVVITDGQWHRVGFVWDGSQRRLYVDDVIVAEDAQIGLASSNGGLYIGCGKGMETGTYFSGLIDDVRIYNRAVSP
jgi:Tol biopolymer transport system component